MSPGAITSPICRWACRPLARLAPLADRSGGRQSQPVSAGMAVRSLLGGRLTWGPQQRRLRRLASRGRLHAQVRSRRGGWAAIHGQVGPAPEPPLRKRDAENPGGAAPVEQPARGLQVRQGAAAAAGLLATGCHNPGAPQRSAWCPRLRWPLPARPRLAQPSWLSSWGWLGFSAEQLLAPASCLDPGASAAMASGTSILLAIDGGRAVAFKDGVSWSRRH